MMTLFFCYIINRSVWTSTVLASAYRILHCQMSKSAAASNTSTKSPDQKLKTNRAEVVNPDTKTLTHEENVGLIKRIAAAKASGARRNRTSISPKAAPAFDRNSSGTAVNPSHDFPTISELMAVWLTKETLDRKRASHRTVVITAEKEQGIWLFTIEETPLKDPPKDCLGVDGWATVLTIKRDGVPPYSAVLYPGLWL